MKCKYLLFIIFIICSHASADWFLRGTQNSWSASQMESAGAGTNTVQLKGVVFSVAGSFKFDHYGDWKENYGLGGANGGNIPIAAGVWDIKFFTDTKNWSVSATQSVSSSSITFSSAAISSTVSSSSIKSSVASSSAVPASIYHLRGTFNAWKEGTLMTQVGTSDTYEFCVNFTGGDGNGGPRFKVDPNGGWGNDSVPAADYVVSVGWVKIGFNRVSKAISVQQNLTANCGATLSSSSVSSSSKSSIASSSSIVNSSVNPSAISSSVSSSLPASIYHLRGTFNAWQEGTLMARVGTTDTYEFCVNFTGGDGNGGPRFKVDPNGGWGNDSVPASDYVVSVGWVKILFNSSSKAITVQQNLAENCGVVTSSSSAGSSVASSVISSSSASSVKSSSKSSVAAASVAMANPVNIAIDSASNRALVVESSKYWSVVAIDLNSGVRSILSDTENPSEANPLNQPFGIAIDSAHNRALVADIQDSEIVAVNLFSGERTLLTPKNSLGVPRDLTIDSARNRVLVIDQNMSAVVAIDLTTGERSIISDRYTPDSYNSFSSPFGIVLDSPRNRALVLDFGLGAVIAVDLTSGARTILSGNNIPNAVNSFGNPKGIALDAARNRVLVADNSIASVIAVDLTTGERTVLSSNSIQGTAINLDSIRGITVDSTNNRALVTDTGYGNIIAVDLTTGARKIFSQ